ncbi:MAG: DCC1-like thiol-disulfide oxidoreductase family protein [Edaphobacter sp.]
MTEEERNAIEGQALFLYDGVCALCNGTVRLLMRLDGQDRLRYAPLQSNLGREVLARFGISTFPDGVVLVTEALAPTERLYQRTDAAAASLQLLGQPWRLAGKVLALVPRRLRDWGYGLVARFRYRLFGRYDTCPLPTPEQRGRLLGL